MARPRIAISAPLLRFRSDEQLISLFRAGSEDAFRVIHDRYRARMLAYSRQMLAGSPADAEDAVQEIFVRAYAGLLASDRRLALRAWLYRVAHNRCIDELRRPQVHPSDHVPAADADAGSDPVARMEQRDALERLIADVQRLPEQQRSALLMRELGGMTYADVAAVLSVTVPAVKSLLVRARVGLAQATEARDTACATIREDLILSHDRGVRASGLARRHLRDCADCRAFRNDVRGVSRQLAAVVPGLGPMAVVAKLLGLGGSGGAAAGGAAASGAAAAGGSATVAGTLTAGSVAGGTASLSAIAGAGHVVTLLAAAVVTAGGAIELQHIGPSPVHHAAPRHAMVRPATHRSSPAHPAAQTVAATALVAASVPATTASPSSSGPAPASARPSTVRAQATHVTRAQAGPSLSELLDPDMMQVFPIPGPVTTTPASATTAPAGTTPGAPSSTSTPAAPTATGSPSSSSSTSAGDSPTATSSPTSTQTAPASATPAQSSSAASPSASAPPASNSSTSSSTGPAATTASTAATPAPATTPSSSAATQTQSRPAPVLRRTTTPTTSRPAQRRRTRAGGTMGGRHGIMAVFTLTENH